MSNVTLGQKQIDPVSKKLLTHYGEKSVFTVYVKRHNGRKITVYMGNGNQLREVLEVYNTYKIYLHDRKYLYHRMIDEPREAEVKLLMAAGSSKDRNPLDLHSGRKKIDFKAGELSAIKNIPKTILTELDAFIAKGHVINAQHVTKTRLVSILFAEFLEMKEKAQLEFLARGDLLLERHKLACGGISTDRLAKEQAHQALSDGEDLL